MARINGISIPGVTAQKDWRGNIVGATINFKRCSDEMKAYFIKIGIFREKSPYNPKFVKKIEEQKKLQGRIIKADDVWNSI